MVILCVVKNDLYIFPFPLLIITVRNFFNVTALNLPDIMPTNSPIPKRFRNVATDLSNGTKFPYEPMDPKDSEIHIERKALAHRWYPTRNGAIALTPDGT